MVNMRVAWFDRSGRRLRQIGEPGEYEGISLSPDESRIAFGRFEPEDGLNHVAICGANEGVARRFTFHRGNQYSPIWSPDGMRIMFSDDYAGVDTLSMKGVTSAGDERPLMRNPESSQYAQSWSPDGRTVLYRRDDPLNGLDVVSLDIAGGSQPQPYLSSKADEAQAQFSPDGRWVAYASSESGRPEVYVQPFPATGAKWQVSTGGGEQPRWRRDGKEMFYLAADRRLMAVPIRVPGAFDAAPAVPLFETTLGVGYLGVSQAYDVTRDGQRFVVASVDPMTPPAPITVVVDQD
jgi:Tol biopolymer transport system component